MRSTALRLSDAACTRIVRAAARAEPREACGLVAGSLVVELPNAHPGRHRFEVRPDDLRAAVDAIPGGWAAVDAVWHSHSVEAPSSLPSAMDEATHPVGKVMIICHGDQLNAFEA